MVLLPVAQPGKSSLRLFEGKDNEAPGVGEEQTQNCEIANLETVIIF